MHDITYCVLVKYNINIKRFGKYSRHSTINVYHNYVIILAFCIECFFLF